MSSSSNIMDLKHEDQLRLMQSERLGTKSTKSMVDAGHAK